jgi:Sec-independent protein secretion pathway component TatC
MLAVPLWLLYELAILAIRLTHWRARSAARRVRRGVEASI